MFSKELCRKTVHFAGVFFLPLLFWSREVFAVLVFLALALYLTGERLGQRGESIPLLTWLTRKCKRPEEAGRLSKGAIFLAVSAIVTPYLYGVEAAALGLSQIFVADVAASLVGGIWGHRKIPWSKTKSWIGTLSFFVVGTLVSLFFVPWPQALCLGLAGAVIESLPIPEGDNLTIPVGVGLVAFLIRP